MESADDAPTLGEVARGMARVERTLGELRTEMQAMAAERVTIDTFNARMETMRQAVDANRERIAIVESRTQSVEDERDRNRLAITIAIVAAIIGPVMAVMLPKLLA